MVASRRLPNAKLLRRTFSYEPDTGLLTWLIQPHPRIKIGQEVGCIGKGGYRHFLWARRDFLAHRIIWKMVTGMDPIGIDHVNGNCADNKWRNLREATAAQNSRNRKTPSSNASGYKGVTFNVGRQKWQAQIKAGATTNYLGLFSNPKDAYAIYCKAARRLHGEFARTS